MSIAVCSMLTKANVIRGDELCNNSILNRKLLRRGWALNAGQRDAARCCDWDCCDWDSLQHTKSQLPTTCRLKVGNQIVFFEMLGAIWWAPGGSEDPLTAQSDVSSYDHPFTIQ